MNVGNCGVNNEFSVCYPKTYEPFDRVDALVSSSGSQIVWCICVGQKYENVYYISRFNILIRGHAKKGAKT